jgi:hypothetical protein
MSLKSTAKGDGFGGTVPAGSADTVDGGSTGSESGTGVTSVLADELGGVVALSFGAAGVPGVVDGLPPDPPLLPDPPLPELAGGTISALSSGFGVGGGFLGVGVGFSTFSSMMVSSISGADAASAIATRFDGLTDFAAGAAAGIISSSSGTIGLRTTSRLAAAGGGEALSGSLGAAVVVGPVVPQAPSETTVMSNATNRADMMPLAHKENFQPRILFVPLIAMCAPLTRECRAPLPQPANAMDVAGVTGVH